MAEYIEFDKDHHAHHHKETFITKYIFSQDHKMIAKQYLFTGVFFYGYNWNTNVSINANANRLARGTKYIF